MEANIEPVLTVTELHFGTASLRRLQVTAERKPSSSFTTRSRNHHGGLGGGDARKCKPTVNVWDICECFKSFYEGNYPYFCTLMCNKIAPNAESERLFSEANYNWQGGCTLAGRRGTLGSKDLDDIMVTSTTSRDKDGSLLSLLRSCRHFSRTPVANRSLPSTGKRLYPRIAIQSTQSETLLNDLTTHIVVGS